MKRFAASLTSLSLAWLVVVSGDDLFISYFALVTVAATGAFGILLLVRRRWRWLGISAGAFAIIGSLGVAGVPSATRLWLSAASIESAGRDVLDGGSPRWAGLYVVESSRVTPSGCAVLITHTVLIDDAGFLYCPRGADSYGFPKLRGTIYGYTS